MKWTASSDTDLSSAPLPLQIAAGKVSSVYETINYTYLI